MTIRKRMRAIRLALDHISEMYGWDLLREEPLTFARAIWRRRLLDTCTMRYLDEYCPDSVRSIHHDYTKHWRWFLSS